MKMVPKYSYECEICGRGFESRYACDRHEADCKAKKYRREHCSYCGGKGYVTEWQTWKEGRDGRDGDYYEVPCSGYVEVRCPRCNSY